MNHSGWKKLVKANGHLQSYPGKFLFIFLLTCGILFTFPKVASTSDVKETDFIYGITGNEGISSGHLQNMESVSPREEINLKGEKIRLRDEEIEHRILEEINKDAFIESKNIVVSVENGIVTLRGTINNLTEHAAAIADAFQGGAIEVRNYLKVKDNTVSTSKKIDSESS